MERNGPAIAREASGPLRRLVAGPDRTRSLPVNRFFRYALPLSLLPLLGLVIGDGRHRVGVVAAADAGLVPGVLAVPAASSG